MFVSFDALNDFMFNAVSKHNNVFQQASVMYLIVGIK